MPSMSQRDEVDVDMDDRLEDMICDIGVESLSDHMSVFEGLHECLICGVSRYKQKHGASSSDVSTKGSPVKVLWLNDGKLHHPADSPQWKTIDQLFPDFRNEPRNFRVGLATDGMNLYGNLSRLRQSGNDIDVFLGPLIEDLKILWDVGVDVFDEYHNESFKMCAIIFCTINDFSTYGNLSRYSVKGHKACLICKEGTCFNQLQYRKKTLYLGHWRFLRDCINVTFGKTQKQTIERIPWKKKFIFFDFPYWRFLNVRHSIDVMHVEKNECDSLIGTLLNIQVKTKGLCEYSS
ncbi:hypothetical protein L6164_028478 [Bauhinia variegata]|uniref:Uncharacterized protein n=1 Tax=Bauhinia variegata TaxID=167791 RepID=A0ACB9L5S8_BAUVA|nr:hypothetical protein L6164_028478 [Bauhinia variegata]